MSAQNAFSGLSAWTHGGTVGYSGGGYLFSFQNAFRNAAMLVDAERTVQLSLVRYPAEVNAQSAIINGKSETTISVLRSIKSTTVYLNHALRIMY